MKSNHKILIALLLINLNTIACAQSYLLPHEICIMSFRTKNNKMVMVAKDKDDKYLIYRFGTKEKIEFEFPGKTKESWSKFKYSYYSRGGGKQNAAQELRHISFTNNNYKYFVYDNYHSESDEFEIGVRVLNLNTQKWTNYGGRLNTKKGSLKFKESAVLEEDEDI
jgi:hypothetical protein